MHAHGETGRNPPASIVTRVSRHEPNLEHDPRLMHYFEPFAERARALLAAGDSDALAEIAGRAQRKFGDSRDPFVLNVRERGDRLARFVKAHAAGMTDGVDPASVEFALGALVYFLSPTDEIPDVRPGGHADDAAVVAFAARTVADDLERTLGA